MKNNIVEMKNISKTFPGVKALDNVSFLVKKGEVHGLVGKNGAGKSTLVKVLTGQFTKDNGELWVDGEKLINTDIGLSKELGIEIVSQHPEFAPELTVAENLWMGRLPKNKLGNVKWEQIYKETEKRLKNIKLNIDPQTKARSLTVGEQQLISIARALFMSAKIIVLDEPTPALSKEEINVLFEFIKKLKDKGTTFIYISHYLQEIFDVCDRVTVLRDGKYISTEKVDSLEMGKLTELMVGKEMGGFPQLVDANDKVILEIRNLNNSKLKDVNFKVMKGEIVGLAGLTGSGRSEVVRAIYGLDSKNEGKIKLKGSEIDLDNPKIAIENGFGYLSEDRRKEGLIPSMSVKQNICLPMIDKLLDKVGLFDESKARCIAKETVEELDIKISSISQYVEFLSGGNQQKVVLGKLLELEPEILLLDEPTKGIDIGAKNEIYKLMNQLCKEGKSIILISSEMEELKNLCNRIYVMHEGSIVKEFSNEELSLDKLLIAYEGGYDNVDKQ